MKTRRNIRLVLCTLGTLTLVFAGYSWAAENTRTVRQPLVGGSVINEAQQEEFGLLTLSSGCSASLLRNDWAITAAHCVDLQDANGNTMPDPQRPGQNVLEPLATTKVTANWKTKQERTATRIETFWPYDVAIIKVDAPFAVNGQTTGYSRLIFQDGQFPYYGNPVGANLLVFGRGINQFATATMPSQGDGQYRIGYAKCDEQKPVLYGYPSQGGQMIGGGDSGGPSFAWVLSGYALVGVHALTHPKYVEGKPKTGWDWVSATPRAADAPIAPVWNQILKIMGPAPPGPTDPNDGWVPPPGVNGTFGTTPKNAQPMWVYAIRPDGALMWYRKDSGDAAWEGPKKVGTGWHSFKDVIPAGGSRFYALTYDDKLMWHQHDGFNEGSANWKAPVEVGSGWTFKRIFSGGEGIVYAIKRNGELVWYRNKATHGNLRAWEEARVIGTGWDSFRDVFSLGQGKIYAVKHDGTLLLHEHTGYANGAKSWQPVRVVGESWQNFRHIVPVGNGVILAVNPDGQLLWYKHLERGTGNLRRIGERWEGPTQIGSGWQDFGKVVAILPRAPDIVR